MSATDPTTSADTPMESPEKLDKGKGKMAAQDPTQEEEDDDEEESEEDEEV